MRDLNALVRMHARRAKHQPGNAHATAKDIALLAQRKARIVQAKVAANDARFGAYKAAVRDYWAGVTDWHP